MSLDSLDQAVFATHERRLRRPATRCSTASRPRSRRASVPVKINAVVKRGVNDHTVLPLLERFRGTPVIVRLIEYMDVGNRNALATGRGRAVGGTAGLDPRALAGQRRCPAAYRGEVAERYAYDDGAGEIGFISSVTRAVLRRLHARPAVVRGRLLHLPVRADGHRTCAAPLRAGAADDELLALHPRAPGPAATTATASCATRCGAAEHPLRKIEMHYIGG